MMYSQTQKIMDAVRALRTALRLTQTDFGLRLGKSLPTIQRWETQRPPRGRALAQLFDLAKQHQSQPACDAAASVFHGALAEEMGGIPVPHGFTLPQNVTLREIHPQTSEEARRVAALLAAMRDRRGEAAVDKFDHIFKAWLSQYWNLELNLRKTHE